MPCIFKLGGCEEIIEVLPTNNNFPTELRIDLSEKKSFSDDLSKGCKGVYFNGR